MSADVKQYGVGVIGTGPFRHHILERLLLRDDLSAVAACPGDHPPQSATLRCCESYSQPHDVIDSSRTHIVYFADPAPVDLLESALQRHKCIVLTSTNGLGACDLRLLAQLAASNGTIAVIDEPRRWDDDFRCAKSVFDAGHLGKLERARLAIYETALPGEVFPAGALRELGSHWLDQLLVFAAHEAQSVRLQQFHKRAGTSELGFLASVDFQDGLSAVIELQTASLLSLQTGWLLEGTSGAYRAGRRHSKTPDGEIVDEPVNVPAISADPFLDHVVKAMAGDQTALATLVPLSHAARAIGLIEMLEEAVLVSR
jgi:scyllo-inositol 2-dehydrogenase (NADP+)